MQRLSERQMENTRGGSEEGLCKTLALITFASCFSAFFLACGVGAIGYGELCME